MTERDINHLKNAAEKSGQQISERKQDIKYDTRDYVVKYIVERYAEGDFYIPLDYQRNFIWGDKDKCRFIESILMGLPIPFMFFADTPDGRIEIVDGAQRTQTLVQFAQNDLELNGLKILTESNGFRFKDFTEAIQKRFSNTSIRVIFLEEGTTERTRQEIFKRINIGGEHAKPAEIRRGSYEGKFKRFLEECAKNDKFNILAPRTELTERRFEGFELVSRFFAYLENYENKYEEYHGNVTEYIDAYVERKNALWEQDESDMEQYEKKFLNMLNYAEGILKSRGFRKSIKSKSTPRARFEALAVGIGAALNENQHLPCRDVSAWIDGDEFLTLTKSDAANNKSKLMARIGFVKNKLLQG